MEILNLTLPASWSECSQRQLRYIYKIIAHDTDSRNIPVLALLKFAGLKVLGKSDRLWLIQKKKRIFSVSAEILAVASRSLDFILTPPEDPVCIARLGGRKSIDPSLEDVSFETYVILDNLYQGYLATQSDEILGQAADILYPGIKMKIGRAGLVSVLYWLMGLKAMFSREFPDFFSNAGESENPLASQGISAKKIQESVYAMIRALTKGDITKERQILAMDCRRALQELNAQAREYKELKSKTK